MQKRLVLILLSVLLFQCKTLTPRPYAQVPAELIYQDLQQRKNLFRESPIELEGKSKVIYPVSLLLARPGFLKISIPPGGEIESKFILVTDGEQFQLKDASHQPTQFLQGPAKPCVLERLLPDWGMQFRSEELVEILLGQPPLESQDSILRSEASWDPHGQGQEVLTLYGKKNEIQKIWLSQALSGQVFKIEMYRGNLENLLWRVEYKGFRQPPGFSISFPEKTIFTNAKSKKEVSISWKKWIAHPEDLEEPWQSEFHMLAPPKTPVYEVTCGPVS